MIKTEQYLTKSGGINAKILNKIPSDEISVIEAETSFLQLNPSLSQRIKTIIFKVAEHSKCICGNYLPYSSNKDTLFKEFCCMSCAKKGKHTEEISKKFSTTLDSKKERIESDIKSAKILDKQKVITFFKQNFSIFSKGGSKGINFLNKNLDYKKSLFFYTSEKTINGRIYELLYGKGICKICSEETLFVSLEKGYKPYCGVHGKLSASKNRGLNAISIGIEKIKSFDNFSEFELIEIPEKLNDMITLKHKKCGETFKICLHNGKTHTYVLHCAKCNNTSVSLAEIEICNFLKEHGVEYIPQYPLENKKIDIYIQKFNLAIEHHGPDHSFGVSTYERFNNAKQESETKNFHLNRHNLCKKYNIDLVHIYESDWTNKTKKNIWKSILKAKLNLNQNIHARKCVVKEVSTKETSEFLDKNHLQGDCKSSVKLGLYKDEELVAMMTFGKPRTKVPQEYELIRFCNKLDYTVVGGASKLFKHFIKTYNPNNIISYCHIHIFDGNLYEKIGFIYSHSSKPGYWYHKNNMTLSRYQCQKHKLNKFLKEFDPNLSESENMFNNGYRRIWDCGNKVYVWEKE